MKASIRICLAALAGLFSACKDQPAPAPALPADSVVARDSVKPGISVLKPTAFIFAPPASNDPYAMAAAREFRENLPALSDSLRALGFDVLQPPGTVQVGSDADRQDFQPCQAWQGCAMVFLLMPFTSWPEVWSGPFTAEHLLPLARKTLADNDDPTPWDWRGWESGSGVRFIPPAVGDYGRGHFPEGTNGEWLALDGGIGSATLTRVQVTVDSMAMDCSDVDGDDVPVDSSKAGRKLTVTPATSFYMLLRGPSLKEGTISSARRIVVDSGTIDDPSGYLPRKVRYQYRDAPVELVRMPRDFIELRYQGRRYPLIQWGPFDEGKWNTEWDWVGDLNGDGVLDVILDVSPKYTTDHWFWLFLSDPAQPELGPQLVDRFSGFGCGHL